MDFSKIVRPGDVVTWSHGAAEPILLIEQLIEQRHQIGAFTVLLGGGYASVIKPEHTDIIKFVGLGGANSNRVLCDAGKLEIIPAHLSETANMLATGRFHVDVVLAQLSKPNSKGLYSFGTTNSYASLAIPHARTVIGEINEFAPWTHSRETVQHRLFQQMIQSDRPIAEVPSKDFSAVDRHIANNIARYIEDGCVIQVGIGSVPNAVLRAVSDRRRLGIHAGVIGDGLIALVECGAVDNSTKDRDRGKSTVAALAGSRRLYDFANNNSEILVDPVSYTHSAATLAGLKRLIAVNSAVEVDLTGQVGSEIAGSKYVGTVGGLVDFIRGAIASPGGRSVIGLPARTNRNTPRIVATLKSGIVTCCRADADIVVTEFGAAELRFCTISERVKKMIAIAHPDDREHLEFQATQTIAGYR